MVVEITV